MKREREILKFFCQNYLSICLNIKIDIVEKQAIKKTEIFNPDHHECCIEIGNCRLENPPKELIELLKGKPISECDAIIKEYFQKQKMVFTWQRKIGFRIPDNEED